MVSCSGSLVLLRCGEGGALLFPVYAAQAPGRSIWSGPCVACGSNFRVFHKSADSVAPSFCAFPSLSSSGSQELDGRTRVRCAFSLPRPQPQFPPALVGCVCIEFSRDPPGGCRPSRISGSLVRNWRPVCSVVGDAVFGAEFALSSPLCLLPQAGLGQSAAG